MKFLIALIALCSAAHGFILEDRIISGYEADMTKFPYMVSVRFDDQHVCGGSILDEDTILTAAHCVHEMDHSQYSVRVGNATHSLGIFHSVSEVREHQSYNPEIIDNDLAILKLSTKITFTDTAQPVELQPQGEEAAPRTRGRISGWGSRLEGGPLQDKLRGVTMIVISKADCVSKFGDNVKITDNMLCGQARRLDFCQGDGGGPFVTKDTGKLIGVISWGKACAKPEYPGVYAKVSSLNDWIQANRH